MWCVFNTNTVTLDEYPTVPSPDAFRLFERVAEGVWDGIVAERYDGCGKCTLCKPRVPKDESGPTIAWED